MAPDRGYKVAKDLQADYFGNGLHITGACMEKVTGWPTVKAEDV